MISVFLSKKQGQTWDSRDMCLISCIFRESRPCICYLRIQGSIKDGHFTSSMTYRSIQIQLKRPLNSTWTSFHLVMILPLVIFSSIGSKSFRQLSSQKRFQWMTMTGSSTNSSSTFRGLN
ncbi:hypothetical protein I7I50_07556 [Histoplasma capsulatum G186AR]|uniref:Uncharacterized protein n=1 Tax=Ajellomyces capsulatus TaxID=5037 RepID=A0A8H7Z0Y7_AJECA|nr:hypothetical protein I7I52_09372 [Histoplasma capsulatum]QSS68222.1 hypothetical protein I7I50_07556 [Histoplasma capsulatum G186AR]